MEFIQESSINFGNNVPFVKNAIGNNRYIILYFISTIYISYRGCFFLNFYIL